jgi:hypothetical protein
MNPQEKAQGVEWFTEAKFDTQVQRRSRTTYYKTPQLIPLVRAWYRQFNETGSVLHKKNIRQFIGCYEKIVSVCLQITSDTDKYARWQGSP